MSKRLIVLAACTFALPLAAGAQGGAAPDGQRSDHEQHSQSSSEAAPGGQPTPAVHEHMQAMREQMARIHAAQDPEERQRLMHEHMQSMEQHMQTMGRMEQGPGPDPRPETRCAQGDFACRTEELQSQHESMRQSMSEMRELMEQMLEHQHATAERAERRR